MSKYCVIGRHGFIGSALAARLGDVTSFPTEDTKVLFHFGGHVHPQFELNPEFEMKRTFDEYTQLLPYCHENGILFVYPSSALVYEKETQFSRFKKTLESMAQCYKTVSLGLRIFPTYGPGENRTVISKWCREMKTGISPRVYGDGSQERAFIYIDDVIDQILFLIESPKWSSRIIDIGSDTPISFNSIVHLINEALGTQLAPDYVGRPANYAEGAVCPNPLPAKIPIAEGIRRILKSIQTADKSEPVCTTR